MAFRHIGLIASAVALALAVGTASAMADIVPYQADWYGLDEASLSELVLFIVVGLFDTYLGWLIGPLLLGYLRCRSAREAALVGGGYVVAAIAIYQLTAYYRDLRDFQNFPEAFSGKGELLKPVLLDYLTWGALDFHMLPLALAGGLVGTLAGFYARRRPALLLALTIAVGMDMARRGGTSWTSAINGPQNVILLAIGLGVIAWTVIILVRRRSFDGPTSSDGRAHRERGHVAG